MMNYKERNKYNGLLQFDINNAKEEQILKEKESKGRKDSETLKKFRRKKLPPMEGIANVKDILKFIFPPQKIRFEKKVIIANVSTEEPEDDTIMNLAFQLEGRLHERQARLDGICDVRSEIYDEAFNELIRQVTINCPERGLLLMNVRDELKARIESYKSLYESSVAFGIRKQMRADEGVDEMEARIRQLERRKTLLENEKMHLANELSVLRQGYEEVYKSDAVKMKSEIAFLEEENLILGGFFDGIKDLEPREAKRTLMGSIEQ